MSRFRNLGTITELCSLIEEIGFIPLFRCTIPGYSVEELTQDQAWWSDDPEHDPWAWRSRIATDGTIAYAKFFNGKAGFISRRWYPLFAAYRRSGMTFQQHRDAGRMSHSASLIMEFLDSGDSCSTSELKGRASISKHKQAGFERAITQLQMRTYITVRGFECKRSAAGKTYGWPVGIYSLSECLFQQEIDKSAAFEPAKAKGIIESHLLELIPAATSAQVANLISI